MDRLHEMEVFAAVIDAGSFAKAAEKLRMSPPAVTRAITSLEDRLRVRLINRTTRSLSLTGAGKRFLESCRRLLGEIEEAERDASGETTLPTGHLALTTSVTFGRTVLIPVVREFQRKNPQVTVSVFLHDRIVNLVEEGIDLGVRLAHLPDSSLMARRLGEIRRILIASPDYLKRMNKLVSPQDLKQHRIIAFTGQMPNREWHYRDRSGPGHVSIKPALEINDSWCAIAAAEAGEGITIAMSYMVADQIKRGQLVHVLSEYDPPPTPVHMVYPHGKLLASKTRSFIDFAVPLLQQNLEGSVIQADGRSIGGQIKERQETVDELTGR
ncbi:MAG: LysR family transcriptional regulator [Hyphomicrobium sp.]|nr:LysR family transcriptional regulator [Hyphomicrobium sp.]